MAAYGQGPALQRKWPTSLVTVVPPTTGFPPLIQNDRITALAMRANALYAEIGKTAALGGNGGASESATVMSVGCAISPESPRAKER